MDGQTTQETPVENMPATPQDSTLPPLDPASADANAHPVATETTSALSGHYLRETLLTIEHKIAAGVSNGRADILSLVKHIEARL
jgi:hypothetical protein